MTTEHKILAWGLVLNLVVAGVTGASWLFVGSSQARVETQLATVQTTLGEVETRQAAAQADLTESDLEYRNTQIVGVELAVQPVWIADGVHQLDVEVDVTNSGFASLRIGELAVEVERGVPDAHVVAALERSNENVPQHAPPSGIVLPHSAAPLVAEIRQLFLERAAAAQRNDVNEFADRMMIELRIDDKVNSLMNSINSSTVRHTKKPVERPEVGMLDLTAKNIKWSKCESLGKHVPVDRILHQGQSHSRTFRFFLEANPPECYRFVVVARPASGSTWEPIYTETTLPLSYIQSLYQCDASGCGPARIESSTEIPPRPDLFEPSASDARLQRPAAR